MDFKKMPTYLPILFIFFQPQQPQSMMQRQLGTSQLPNSSSHRGSMMAPPTNGNMRNRQVCYC